MLLNRRPKNVWHFEAARVGYPVAVYGRPPGVFAGCVLEGEVFGEPDRFDRRGYSGLSENLSSSV